MRAQNNTKRENKQNKHTFSKGAVLLLQIEEPGQLVQWDIAFHHVVKGAQAFHVVIVLHVLGSCELLGNEASLFGLLCGHGFLVLVLFSLRAPCMPSQSLLGLVRTGYFCPHTFGIHHPRGADVIFADLTKRTSRGQLRPGELL